MRIKSCNELGTESGRTRTWLCGLLISMLFVLVPREARAVPAGSVFTVNISQQGSDVVVSGSGSFNTTGLTMQSSGGSSAVGINPSTATLGVGDANGFTDDVYVNDASFGPGLIGSSNFGSGGHASPSTGTSPDFLFAPGILVLPNGYASGTSLTDSSTYSGATLSSLGITPGTYSWTWGGAQNNTLLLNVVPEPSSLLLIGEAMFCIAAVRRRGRIT